MLWKCSMKTVLRRSGFAPPQTPLTREENWGVCASGLQLSGGAGQQVLLSVLRGFCQPAVDRVQLPTCGVWRPRDGGCGEIILKRNNADAVRAHTCFMRATDFRDAEALLIRLSHLARPNREAALILERVKLYLGDQFDRGDHPYVLPAELAAAGKTTCRFFPREGDAHPNHQ